MEVSLWNAGSHRGAWHAEQTTVWLLFSGQGTVCLDGETFSVHPGDLILQRAGRTLRYDLRCTGLTGRVLLPRQMLGNQKAILSGACTEQLRRTFFYILEMTALLQSDPAQLQSFVHRELETLFWLLLTNAGVKAKPADPVVTRVIDEIGKNLSNPDYDPQETIARLNYSASYFRRLFRAETGVSPGQFLRNWRINLAKTEMRKAMGEIPLQEVAERAGFRDTYAFSRHFKSREGISPSEFLQRLREQA